jgi:hypothetical protein
MPKDREAAGAISKYDLDYPFDVPRRIEEILRQHGIEPTDELIGKLESYIYDFGNAMGSVVAESGGR